MEIETVAPALEKAFAQDLLRRKNNGERFSLEDEARIEAALEVVLGATDVVDPAHVAEEKRRREES